MKKQQRIDSFIRGGTNGPQHGIAASNRRDANNSDVKWARSCTGPVVNKDAPNLTCYGCDGSLSFVKKHDRMVNGITRQVRSCYRHQAGTRCKDGGENRGETLEHLAAKDALCAHGPKWVFKYKCKDCASQISIKVSDDQSDTFSEEVTWKTYRLDVGIMRGGNVVGAVEVMKSHASTAEKINDLTEGNIAWCEVLADTVLKALENGTFEVDVVRCAVQLCEDCIDKESEKTIETLNKELRLSTHEADEDRLRQKRQRIIQEATDQWMKMEPCMLRADEEQKKWIVLSHCVQQAVVAKAAELGLSQTQAEMHAHDVVDSGDPIIWFRKHPGWTLSQCAREDWSYLVWLAGYTGKIGSDNRAERRAANGSVLSQIETKAANHLHGRCYRCGTDIEDYDECPWKTHCRACFARLKVR
jgi:hypothetical protein